MTPPKEMIYFVKCLAGVRHGEDLLKSGNDDLAEEWFHKTLDLANSAPPEISRDLVPYTLCFLSLAYQKRGLVAKSRESRERSTKLLDSSPDHLESTFFQTSMAEALSKLKDYRRAIPFWEKALASAEHEQDAQSLAGMLHQLGVCYCRIGLKEHAMVPLRAALKILESCPEHPLLPGVLLTLGNALRKSAPYEAERYYSETARIYSSRFQYESATPAWTNLAILFSEQGRHAESLELHERVLRVRENAVGTFPSRIAMVHNNIACTYRRMGALDKALENVDRALAIFPTTDGEQAGAYSTRAMILRDAGSEAEAVEWFQKAFLARMEQASPDLASAADDLDGEIALLKKLGRTDDIIEAEAKLAAIHRTLQDTPESGSNFDAAKGFDQGMVLVELAIGGKQRKLSGSDRLVSAIRKLVEAIQSQGVGELSGDITIPESTTLIFSGRDADKLFDVLGPLLRSEPVCAGARIVVRQGDAHREIAIPHSPTGLN